MNLHQEIQERLNNLTSETPAEKVRGTLEKMILDFVQLDELEFEGLWADLDDRLNLKGKFYAALRRRIKETRKELKRSASVQKGDPGLSPEEELKKLKPLAEPLIQCPDILSEVMGILNRMGLAGQEREAKIIYLALTSRIFERPVNVAVKGPSSCGKSFLVEECLGLMPESAYYPLSAMSEKALAYSQEPMCHRHLVIYEAAGLGGETAQYLMRSLLSEGRIRYETVDKTGGGMKSRLIEREGPTGLIVTTTRAGLHPENETRILSLEVDDSPRQTQAVILAHAKGKKPTSVDPDPFQALQRILEIEQPQVFIPFAEPLALGCNTAAVRLRRDFPMVLTLIKAHAALHFHHRAKDEQGRIIATFDDYQAIYDLVGDLVACCTGQKISPIVRETVEAVKALLEDDSNVLGVSIQELAKHLGRDKSTALRRANVALKANYLVNQETRKYAPYKLMLGDPMPDNQTVLPPPNNIKRDAYSLEISTTLQSNDESVEISCSYGLQFPLQPSCNPQAASAEMQGCASGIRPATDNATDNHMNLFEKDIEVAELRGDQGDIKEKNSLFLSGEEFDL